MLGTNAKEREKKILFFLYLNKEVKFDYIQIAEHTKTRIGVSEAIADLVDYKFLECIDFDELKLLDQMFNFIKDKKNEINMPKYQITAKGIKYIETTEFNKHKGNTSGEGE